MMMDIDRVLRASRSSLVHTKAACACARMLRCIPYSVHNILTCVLGFLDRLSLPFAVWFTGQGPSWFWSHEYP